MTNQEKWPIGTKVKFDYDDLEGFGTIVRHKTNTVMVCLDDSVVGGWEISDYECPRRPELWRKRGWHVSYTFLQKHTTKLGNQL